MQWLPGFESTVKMLEALMSLIRRPGAQPSPQQVRQPGSAAAGPAARRSRSSAASRPTAATTHPRLGTLALLACQELMMQMTP